MGLMEGVNIMSVPLRALMPEILGRQCRMQDIVRNLPAQFINAAS